jgi:hypothetical protein
VPFDQFTQTQTLVQLAHQNQATIRRNSRSLEIDLQRAVERELKWLVSISPIRCGPPEDHQHVETHMNRSAGDQQSFDSRNSNWKSRLIRSPRGIARVAYTGPLTIPATRVTSSNISAGGRNTKSENQSSARKQFAKPGNRISFLHSPKLLPLDRPAWERERPPCPFDQDDRQDETRSRIQHLLDCTPAHSAGGLMVRSRRTLCRAASGFRRPQLDPVG